MQDFKSHGMTWLSDPATRVRVCAGCHVGAGPDVQQGLPARDLRHDLIAAGHPRLAFEFTTYEANLPPHWVPKKGQAGPARSAVMWAVGRLESAKASLDLLTHRACANPSPWPEFAEYDCFACHANLREPSWRATKSYYRGRTPGVLPYSVWHTTGLSAMQLLEPTPGQLDLRLRELSGLMAEPLPPRKAVAGKARALSTLINEMLKRLPAAEADQGQAAKYLLANLLRKDMEVRVLSWDEIMQLVLALEALHPPDAPKFVERLQKLRPMLGRAFPPRYDSPADFRRDAAMDEELRRLSELLWK